MWGVLRSMVFDATGPPNRQYYRLSDRLAFLHSNPMLPPPNTYVWAAPFGGRTLNANFKVLTQISDNKENGVVCATTLMSGALVQVLAWKGELGKLDIPRLIRLRRWPTVARQFWPVSGDDSAVYWPPARQFSDRSLDAFIYRFCKTRGRFS
jgi:hypothetical protein